MSVVALHLRVITWKFHCKLRSALSMEHDSLEMLGDMEKIAMRSDLKELFRGHDCFARRQRYGQGVQVLDRRDWPFTGSDGHR
ncbi:MULTISPECIES: DUF892 family protein [Arthrobacter]|uniref:DUF892 family protein n=1 Tax=Arthrobacter TaxID=1663 RepID=UPI0037BE4923